MVIHLDQKVDRLQDELAARIEALDHRLSGRIEALDQKVSKQFIWLVGIQIMVLLAVIGALLGKEMLRVALDTADSALSYHATSNRLNDLMDSIGPRVALFTGRTGPEGSSWGECLSGSSFGRPSGWMS